MPHPVPDLPPDSWARLPEPEDLAALEAAAAAAYGVADPAMVVAAPGTQVLIGLLPRLFPTSDVAVLGPTYAEHAAAWRAAGATVREMTDPAALRGVAAAVICNPNNPDGRRLPPQGLRDLAATVPLLVVDEAFADFHAEVSLAPALPMPGVVLLRSFGKPYGLAGVRLGFALAAPELAAAIRAVLGPWPVSGAAIAAGRRALADPAWLSAARARLAADAGRLDALLDAAGMPVAGGTLLFRLTGPVEAEAIADALGRAGILVRRFPGRLRFGLPAPGDWTRVEQAVRDIGKQTRSTGPGPHRQA